MLSPGMVGKIVLGVVILLAAAVVIVTYAGPVTSSAPPPVTPSRSLSSSRLFMLLPDGKVEVTDAWARRVYRWDGRVWVELEVTKLSEPPVGVEPR